MKFSVAVAGLALASAQPITYSGYVQPHPDHGTYGWWDPDPDVEKGWLLTPYGCKEGNQDEWVCGFNKVLATLPGTENPSIRDYLTMFSKKYVENKFSGKFFAVKNSRGSGALTVDRLKEMMKDGLYEVLVPGPNYSTECSTLSYAGTCLVFKLLIEADNIGQIIAAPTKYDPIQGIGVDQVSNKIYGYYPTESGDWHRKRTKWGDAKDGSLSCTDNEVIGLSKNDKVRILFEICSYAVHYFME